MRLRNVILASHGMLCEGMKDSLRMIAGEDVVKSIRTFSLVPGESATDFAQELKKEMEENVNDEYIVITDVFGGSVHSSFVQILTVDNLILFTGMNMAMVLEILMTKEGISNDDMKGLCKAGTDGIGYYTKNSIVDVTEKEDF